MQLRKSTPNDYEQIAQILKECYNIDSIEEGIEVVEQERLKGHHYILAIDNGNVIGITTWLMHGLPKHGLFELDRIAVTESARGKGVAKQLFDALVKDAKSFYEKKGHKARKLYILTHADNTRAQSFYKKMGTSHETTLKSHYYKDKDEFVFSIFI